VTAPTSRRAAAKPAKTRPAPAPTAALPILKFPDRAAWAAWLGKHGARSKGIWIELAKKASGVPTVSYAEAVEEALCHGWIDGQKQSAGSGSWLQKFTPRGPRSIWSQINRGKALALIEAGRMQPAGLAEVERAQGDGRWQAAYAPPKTARPGPEFQAALDANPRAKAFFATLESRNRYAVLWRIETAKKPETRARRIADLVAMLARHEKLHP
jgi:uncharacterized protein YdeI (YjbR/CyaY-like superfamily)